MPHAPDVFVLSNPECADSIQQVLEGITTNLRGAGRVVVIGEPVTGLDHLPEMEILGFDRTAMPGKQALFLELVKWELRRFSQTPSYVVVDTNVLLTKPANVWLHNRPALFCQNRFRFGHLMCFNYFFGQIPYPASPAISAIQHFDRAVVREMVEKIQLKYKLHWLQATAAILQQVAGTAFNAGQIYGHYLRIFHRGSFEIVELSDAARISQLPEPAVVRMATLGHNGRFANQLFQYAFLHTFAQRRGLKAECPPWIGCSLFGHSTTLSESELPIFREDKGETESMIRFDPKADLRNFELWGYFQDSSYWADDRQAFRRLFAPLPFLKSPLDAAIQRLCPQGSTLVAIHLRRGDFSGGETFWPAPEAWYLNWLETIWPTLANPVLYVASDDVKNVLPHFARYSPRSSIDLQVNVNGAAFYPDFYLLSKADVIGISNSTFSFAAAMMNEAAKIMVRPDPITEAMIDFDPWQAPVQLKKPTTAMSPPTG